VPSKAQKAVFETISKRARRLLNREEAYDVEFKASLGPLEKRLRAVVHVQGEAQLRLDALTP